MRLAGKVAIIPGCAGGTGEAAARLFAREGAKVAAVEPGKHRIRVNTLCPGATGADFVNDAGWMAMSGIPVQQFAR